MNRGSYRNAQNNNKNSSTSRGSSSNAPRDIRKPAHHNNRPGAEVITRMPGVPDIKLGK